jgi:hypothetical protein
MKPMLFIFGFSALFVLLGWTWSELPRPMTVFVPTWSESYRLYGQPHAIWLDQYDSIGANLPKLAKTLKAAASARQIPELVVYAIPMRDLGQSSEGGFQSYEDYLADNRQNARLIQQFNQSTGVHPIVYLEPDSIPLAVQYQRDQNGSEEARKIYAERIRVTQELIELYQQAGARVYLEAGHSGWFDYGEADLNRIATALNEAHIEKADGLATNVSNRQPVEKNEKEEKSIAIHGQKTEVHYLRRLLPLLKNPKLDVRVDTSRNGGGTQARQYYLHPEGLLIDNETPTGRWVGMWQSMPNGDIQFQPFFGKARSLSRLTGKEKYSYNSRQNILSAPAWLDAVGDVQPGPAPTDKPPAEVSDVIHHYRYIKPPDDCDGALNCPPGASKHAINQETHNRQQQKSWTLPSAIWKSSDSSL